MAKRSTTKLLLINGSDNESEALISLFRNAGHVARAQRVASAEEFDQHLAKADEWDLVVINDNHPELQPQPTLAKLSERCPNLPVIAISNTPAEALYASGASDVVASEDSVRLIHGALREIGRRRLQRQLNLTQSQLVEAEQRSALLLNEANDAIAYVADGMVINANPLFAERFGFTDADELDCVPIVDLVAESDHERLKAILKSQQGSDQDNQLDFTGVSAEGDHFQAMMLLSNSRYEEEPCIQLLVREQGSLDSHGAGNDANPAGAQDAFHQQLVSTARQIASGSQPGALLYIGINDFADLRKRLSLSGSQALMAELSQHLGEQLDDKTFFSQAGDDAIIVLLRETDIDSALTQAQTLASMLDDHIVELSGQSVQVSAAIGVVPLTTNSGEDIDRLLDCGFEACLRQREEAGSGATIYAAERKSLSLSTDAEVANNLVEALEDNLFLLVFQPTISLRGAKGEHYEVRVRMRNQDGEEEAPQALIDALIRDAGNTKLDRWIILEATKLLAAHRSKDNDTRLFINLTPNALQDESLLPWLGVALKAAGLPADALIMQFTEDELVTYLKPAKQFSTQLHDLGCRMSVNRFGKGQDPAKLLKQLRLDFAKIDGSFTAECLQSGGDQQALKALVSAIAENGVKAIISHVENASAMATLWQLGVDYIQGNYLQAPSHEMNYEFTDIA